MVVGGSINISLGWQVMDLKIGSALISVYEKKGLEELLSVLGSFGVELISTGGTWEYISQLGHSALKVETLSGYPSILGGRVKTLHPSIFGGILARRNYKTDEEQLVKHNIRTIDLVVVDLYPFEEALASQASEEELIEKIDIGGVSLLRAAAKNFIDVVVLSSRDQYATLAALLTQQNGNITLEQRRQFAKDAFVRTANYDAAIAGYFTGLNLPPVAQFDKVATLRYGENPHQKAEFRGDLEQMFEKLHGKELSYNNLLDLEAGLGLLAEFSEPTFVVIKHGTPCGVASATTPLEAWKKAYESDTESVFGGIILTNCTIDKACAEALSGLFFEVCIAADFTAETRQILEQKRNRILLKRGTAQLQNTLARSVLNGVLVQERDTQNIEALNWVTAKTSSDVSDIEFANKVVKHCKSNAIAIVKNKQLIGNGAGQTSRVDAVRQAIEKAHRFHFELKDATLASDAFFPFADSVELAAREGVTVFVQPGGSVRDKEVIDACNKLGVAMLFTGLRHFKH